MSPDDRLVTLLQELVYARGPSGQEDEVRAVCERELQPLCDETWVDAAGNVIGLVKGSSADGPAIRVMAHLDELALVVKRVNEDGTLRVNPLGGIYPANYGQGPRGDPRGRRHPARRALRRPPAYHGRLRPDLGDQDQGRQRGHGLESRVRVHPHDARAAEGGGRARRHPRGHRPVAARILGNRRLHRRVLHGQPGGHRHRHRRGRAHEGTGRPAGRATPTW